MSYGTYLLSEIQAPSGYILNENPTTFTISTSTFTKGPILSIYNVEKPRIQLPKTGTAATSLAAIGLLCLVSSIMMNRSRCSSKKEKYNEKV
ncbi:prealbumin-like fold domain-containing protein [Streptococcus suis]|uniref:prealbumin-like fold domain-containing protein n=1 Tax=Streptococcus suis TaxID=1307 RepID=UPI0037C6A641